MCVPCGLFESSGSLWRQVWRVLTSALHGWFIEAIAEYFAVLGHFGVDQSLRTFQMVCFFFPHRVAPLSVICSLFRLRAQLVFGVHVVALALAALILRKSSLCLALETERAFPLRRMLFPTLGQSALSAAKAFDCYLIASGKHSATNEQLLAFARNRWHLPSREHWLREVGPSLNWVAFSSHLQYYLFQPGMMLHPRVVTFVRVLIEAVSGIDFLKQNMRLSSADDTAENRLRLASEYSALPLVSEWQFALHVDRAVLEHLPVPGLCTIVADFLYPHVAEAFYAPQDDSRVLAGRVARCKQLLSLSRLLNDPAILLYPRDADDFDDGHQVLSRADRERVDLEAAQEVQPLELRDEIMKLLAEFYAVADV
jgi:hypothetical protein